MKTLFNFCMKFKWALFSVGLLVLAFMFTHCVAGSDLNGLVDQLRNLNQRIQRHHITIAMTHAMIITLLYYGWGKKVEYEAKKYHLSAEKVKKYKRFRYVLIGFILLIDYITFCH